jgi:hypothetical protein
MLKTNLALFLLISVCGCAASAPKTDQGTAQGIALRSIRGTLNNYNDCLKQNVRPYLKMNAKTKDIADAVARECEPKLSDYKAEVRDFFAAGLDPKTNGYSRILVSKPESHANKIREKGRRATIARVLDARKLVVN